MARLFVNTFIFSFMILSVSSFAQDYKFDPVPNKAEYYVSKFNDGKGYKDYVNWVKQTNKILDESGLYENFDIVLFQPYFNSDLSTHDVVFLGLWPNSTEQYKGLEFWVQNGVSQMKKIPVSNMQVVDTWQWPISSPEGNSEVGAVRFSDCKLKEGISSREAFDAYSQFAEAAKESGDNLGRKMIFPSVGASEGDYDYVYSLYANTVAELGSGADNYWENINGSEADIALGEVIESCNNYRTYITETLR